LDSYKTRTYDELEKLMNNQIAYEKTGVSGVKYQIEIQVFWDDPNECAIRVLGSIDDGGWRAFFPMNDSFIMKLKTASGNTKA